MEQSRSILKLETTTQTEPETQQTTTTYMCTRCGKHFIKPIFAVNNSPGVAEGYYACPSCLTKIEIKKEEKKEEKTKETNAEITPSKPETTPVNATPTTPTLCAHYAGYLKKRPKNTPVPEECFTCTIMLDCMSR